MASAFFNEQHEAVKAAYARGLGGPVGAFAAGGLTVVERPAQHWGYLVSAVTFASGTLVSVEPELLGFARARAPAEPRLAADRDYLEGLRSEAVRLGLRESPNVFSGDILWALSSLPQQPVLPPDLRLEAVGRNWLTEQFHLGTFENGAGFDEASGRLERNRYGLTLRTRAGDVVALAGVFDTYGLSEVGVDVVESHQGRGFGAAIVSAAVREILERGETPLYGCSRTNIRSQRTALATGFLPVCAEGAVV